MLDYQRAFLEFAIQEKVIQFGSFTLKSGRQSPYFFNAGLFYTGEAVNKLGQFYASALMNENLEFDILFGPAYKGIPLVTTTAVALSEYHNRNTQWCFNRKEVKTHGEGGHIVGAPLRGKTVIIDDVITAGTAVRDVMNIIEDSEAQPTAILIALDRQERGKGALSAIQEVERDFSIPVISIVKLEHLMEYTLQDDSTKKYASAIQSYTEEYGITS